MSRDLTAGVQGLVLMATLVLSSLLVIILPNQSVARRGVESDVVVNFRPGLSGNDERTLVREYGGRVTRDLGFGVLGVRMTGGEAASLNRDRAVISARLMRFTNG